MSAVMSDGLARELARRLEKRERDRSGSTAPIARTRVASQTGIAVGTLENLIRGRSKGVRSWVFQRLQEALIHELRREQRAIAHELDTLIRLGRDVDCSEIRQIETSLERIREALGSHDPNLFGESTDGGEDATNGSAK